MDDATDYTLLKTLESNPQLTQRQLARQLGFSLGKVNYCLRALMDKGWVKADNFRNSPRKGRYLYVLTPSGIDARARLTKRFLQRKLTEYEELKEEIERLRQEAGDE